MQYKTHIVTTAVLVTPFLHAHHALTVPAFAFLCLGAVAPDIDTPNSYIGKRTRGISDALGATVGHRGATHTAIACVLVFLCSMLVGSFFHHWLYGLCFSIGYFCHVLEDSFSKSGVKWLYPFKKKFYHPKRLYYKTGSLVELAIFFGMIGLLAVESHLLHYSSAVTIQQLLFSLRHLWKSF